MKLKRIGILVVAAAVLAVMTSGMASAATSTFSGTLSTTYYPSYSMVQRNSQASGSFNVNVYDTLVWHNSLNNQQNHQLTAFMNSTVWSNNPRQQQWGLSPSAYTLSINGYSTITPDYSGLVQEDATRSIEAWHGYLDNNVVYNSLSSATMSYS